MKSTHFRRILWTVSLLPALCLVAPLSSAAKPQRLPADPTTDPAMIAAGFLDGHPDLKYRKHGLAAYGEGRHQEALAHFRRAARYGDKPSQSMVAEMYWSGQATEQDRVLGYVWMDLAAERGYAVFVAMRERYWAELTRDERLRVAAAGEAVYAEFGDAVAQPRLATVLRRTSRNVTGSRTGMVGNVKIFIPGPGGIEDDGMQIDGATFYHPRYWDPVQYQAWQDTIWMNPRLGTVSVGAVTSTVGDTDAISAPQKTSPPPADD